MQETEREIQYKHYIEGFYPIAKKILQNYPDKLEEFEKQWGNKRFRWAYIPYMKIYFQDQWEEKLTPEEKKIDAEFYWLFVN